MWVTVRSIVLMYFQSLLAPACLGVTDIIVEKTKVMKMIKLKYSINIIVQRIIHDNKTDIRLG